MISKPLVALLAGFSLFIAACSPSVTSEVTAESQTTLAPATTQAPPPSTTAAQPPPTVAPTTASPTTVATTLAPEQPPTTAAAADPSTSDDLELLDAGAEPRVERRFALTPGVSLMKMTQTQLIEQVVDGNPLPSVGEVVIEMVQEMVVAEEGDGYRVSSAVISAEPAAGTEERLAELLREGLEPVLTLRTESLMNTRGVLSDISVVGDDTAPAGIDLETLTRDAAIPLPAEPVGIGARWQATRVLSQAGLEIVQVTTYDVVDIVDNTLVLDMVVTQAVPAGSTMRVEGASGEVLEWVVDGGGRLELDLNSAIPFSNASTTAFQSFDFGPGGMLEQNIRQSMRIETAS